MEQPPQPLEIPLMFGDRVCGTVNLDEVTLQEEFLKLFRAAQTVAAAYDVTPPGPSRRPSTESQAASSSDYVRSRVVEFGERVLVDSFLDWFLASASDLDLFGAIENGTYHADSGVIRTFAARIGAGGSRKDKARLAKAFRRQAGIKPGRPATSYPGADEWVRLHYARINAAVAAARNQIAPDDEPLADLVRDLLPGERSPALVRRVHRARRAGDARELIVAARFGMGREKARATMRAARRRMSRGG